MDEIIKIYNDCGYCELEYRIKTSTEKIKDTYYKLLKQSTSYSISVSINFIDEFKNIKQVLTRQLNGEEIREENLYNKKPLKKIHTDNYKLTLSKVDV